MPRYRNRPDRRVLRVVSPLIQPVVLYSGVYQAFNKVDFTFLSNMQVDGIPAVKCIDGTGGLIATSTAVEVISPTVLRITFSGGVDSNTYLFFFEQNQTAVRSVTGGFPTSEPVPVFSA
jgi:hypothetical protein